MSERLTVAQFNEVLSLHLGSLGEFEIEGEVSSFRISQRGGVFITLHDKAEQAILELTGYRPQIEGLALIEEGMKVVVYGTPSFYAPNGKFSLAIRKVQPEGEGALAKAYQKLYQLLDREGLFDISRKRELPSPITKVALLTGKDSAAYSDFIKIFRESDIKIGIDFYPVHVQGSQSASDITKALKHADTSDADIVVLIRGGGSLEDLASFNDENVARALFAMKTPTIAGIGHERDESIAEFVADKRASTPSQAAYYVVDILLRYMKEQFENVQSLENRLLREVDSVSSNTQTTLQKLVIGLQKPIQRASVLMEQLPHARERLSSLITFFRKDLSRSIQLLDSYNPEHILQRGYAIAYSGERIVSKVSDISLSKPFRVTLSNGGILTRKFTTWQRKKNQSLKK